VLIAGEAGIGKTALVHEFTASAAGGTLAPLLDELRAPTVLVLEDLHWADEATLDMLRLLGRRVSGVPALVLGTHRDVGAAGPLRVALGELPAKAVHRIPLGSLSPEAVASLAGPYGADPDELFERTGGNPFYVTEALAAGGAHREAAAHFARAPRVGDRLPSEQRAALLERSLELAPKGGYEEHDARACTNLAYEEEQCRSRS